MPGIHLKIIMACAVFILIGCAGPDQQAVCFNEMCVIAEVADTPDKRAEGLMFRESLEPDKGMLFVYDKETKAGFWMKNTLIPLDIIWIDKAGRVVFIYENARPCSGTHCTGILPGGKAKYVLEVNAGTAQQAGLRPADKVTFKKPWFSGIVGAQ